MWWLLGALILLLGYAHYRRVDRTERAIYSVFAMVLLPVRTVAEAFGRWSGGVRRWCRLGYEQHEDRTFPKLVLVSVVGIIWTVVVVVAFVLEKAALEDAGGDSWTSATRALIFVIAPTMGAYLVKMGFDRTPKVVAYSRPSTLGARTAARIKRFGQRLSNALGQGFVLVGLAIMAASVWAHVVGGEQRARTDDLSQRQEALVATPEGNADSDVKVAPICTPGQAPTYLGAELGIVDPIAASSAATTCAKFDGDFVYAYRQNSLIAALMVIVEGIAGVMALRFLRMVLLGVGMVGGAALGLGGGLLALLGAIVVTAERTLDLVLRLVTDQQPERDYFDDHRDDGRPEALGEDETTPDDGGDESTGDIPLVGRLDDLTPYKIEELGYQRGRMSVLHKARFGANQVGLLKVPVRPPGWTDRDWARYLDRSVERERNVLAACQHNGGVTLIGAREDDRVVAVQLHELGSLIEFFNLVPDGRITRALTLGQLLVLLHAVVQFHAFLWSKNFIRFDGHPGNYVVGGKKDVQALSSLIYELTHDTQRGHIKAIDHGYTITAEESLRFPATGPSAWRPPEVRPGEEAYPTVAWDVFQIAGLGRTLIQKGGYDPLRPRAFRDSPLEELVRLLNHWLDKDPGARLSQWVDPEQLPSLFPGVDVASAKATRIVAGVDSAKLAGAMQKKLRELLRQAGNDHVDEHIVFHVDDISRAPADGDDLSPYPLIGD